MTVAAMPAVRGYLEEVEAIRLEARALIDELSDDQLNWQPSPGRWSVAQCLEHITRTLRLYPAQIERMLEEARTRMATGVRPYRESAFSRWFVRSMEPPPKVRVRTARRVEPPHSLTRGAVIADFDAEHANLARLIAAADGLSLGHARMRSPFFPLFRFTLGQTIAINLAHARRHLWQARQVRKDPAFPTG